ncbi:MAG: SusC/RagA family TonB-linked outer membrane protein [Chitinophagales bacterium]|nr:SusC/RagA family TonB-linked outer membrane protein [Chitinophagales bacterium]
MKKSTTQLLFCMMLLLVSTFDSWAQNSSIKGKVLDEKSQLVPYATVQLSNSQYGATTEEDGTYEITNVPPGTYSLQVSYVGYLTFLQTVTTTSESQTVDINLKPDYQSLDEVVVVGYGTKTSKDLTGSITSLSTKDFGTGNIATPEQLITGKVAGVQITSNGGAPGSGSTIRIRGGSSLNASNDPLIVIDGVPVDNDGVSGSANALNLINPADIENITVLKDASAAAIYGSRAANGVIIITTKRGPGSGKLSIGFNTNLSVSTLTKHVDVLTADEFRDLVNTIGTDKQKELLGTSNTDWQEEIYRTAISSDNNLTFTGGIKNLPYRLGLGYMYNSGVLLRSQFNRANATLSMTPTFLENHLSVTINAKYSYTNNFFADQGAIGSAVGFDPTQPIYSDTSTYNGYFEWLDPTTGKPNTLAPKNPLGLLESRDDKSNVNRFLGNVQLDYKFHFLPELRANLNLGGDWTRSNGTIFVDSNAASNFLRHGVKTQYDQGKNNKLLEFYLNYTKDLKNINSKLDLTGGYSYQDWISASPWTPYTDANGNDFGYPDINAAGDTITPASTPSRTQHTLISFYGRVNYTFAQRYLFTFTLRDDGSSRFSPDTRWGLFPSAAFAWRISDEAFMKDSKVFSNLKLRLGWGITGQQDIFSDYPYIANYSQGTSTAQIPFGNTFYYVLRPDGYDANIKWEETETRNIGLDFGFMNGRLYGSVDVYHRLTSDLLAVIPVPAGTNFTNNILTNIGSLENKGIEATLAYVVADKQDFYFDLGVNVTYNKNEITKLSKVQDSSSLGILTGGIGGVGIGNTIQIHSVGFPTNSFYVYKQLYDENGKPIEGGYADLNGDSVITAADKYRYEKAAPDVYLGFNASARYKKWSAGFSLRGSFGNYVYNNINSGSGSYDRVDGSKNYINNLSTDYYNTEFQKTQFQSDYYIEDASFVRMDYLNVGYNFGNIIQDKASLNITGTVQNVFVITGYSGLDPEVFNGIDNSIYPRPRIYSLILDLKF